jgi:hypothetical protein
MWASDLPISLMKKLSHSMPKKKARAVHQERWPDDTALSC